MAKAFADNSGQKGNPDQIAGDVYGIIDNVLNLPPGHAKAHQEATLLILGADSMSLARLVQNVARQTGARLNMAELFSFPSVGKVVRLAEKGSSGDSAAGESISAPAALSLLPFGKDKLEVVCQEAGVQVDDLEDAFPHSASQGAFFDAFAGEDQDNDLLWMLNRYHLAEGTDHAQLVQALFKLQEHEESLRWTMASSPETGWITLQSRPGTDNRVEELSCASDDDAKHALDARLAACKHVPGAQTARIYLVTINARPAELAFLESHGFTEGRARTEILESLEKLLRAETPAPYTPYSAFVQRHPRGADDPSAVAFWQREAAAMTHSEDYATWATKSASLLTPPRLAGERLQLLGVSGSVAGAFTALSVRVGMTLPLVVEAVFALSLALYLGQQGEEFKTGHVVYDRAVSMRSSRDEAGWTSLRALAQAYVPNFLLLDVARGSLWYVRSFACALSAPSLDGDGREISHFPDDLSALFVADTPATWCVAGHTSNTSKP